MDNDKYDLHDIAYGVQGWDLIMAADMQIINNVIPTRILGTLGETVSAYKALYLDEAAERWHLAQADGSKQPCLGLSIESGILNDEIRIHRMGEIENESWSWSPGGVVYLDPDYPGELTQDIPQSGYKQIIGYALSATVLLVSIHPPVRAELPIYANNAAAIAGGLEVGDFYRSGGDPDIVCVVHSATS